MKRKKTLPLLTETETNETGNKEGIDLTNDTHLTGPLDDKTNESIDDETNEPFDSETKTDLTETSYNAPDTTTYKCLPKYNICDICGAVLRSVKTLEDHFISGHNGLKPYACDLCDKRFNKWRLLRLHKVVHSDQRNYICDQCGLSFLHRCSFLGHQARKHGKDKPHECDICQHRFALRCDLFKHRKRHSHTRDYKCQFCDKAFYNSTHLKVHTRIHTGDKPYVCQVCGKGFNQGVLLRLHLKKPH